MEDRRDVFLDNGDTLPVTFNVDHRELEEGDLISDKGKWGPVHKARWLPSREEVAIKKFDARSTSLSRLLMSREAIRLLRLRHPNIVYLRGFYFLAERDWILTSTMIMELMDCDLDGYIKSKSSAVPGGSSEAAAQGLPFWNEGLYIIAQIAHGMNHVHFMGYCHRDLKPQNILVRMSQTAGGFPEIKIADFGCSEIMTEVTHCNRNAGTLLYKAPEQFDGSNATPMLPAKADVYSFAVLCSKILTGIEPYSDQTYETTPRQHIGSGNTPTIPKGLPKEISALLQKCLARNPVHRPDFSEICATLDPFLNKIWKKKKNPPRLCRALEAQRSDADHLNKINDVEETLVARGFPTYLKECFIDKRAITECYKIGQGTDAVVYKVEWKGNYFAGRCVPVRPEEVSTSAALERAAEFERAQAARLPTLKHDNIVEFFGLSLRPNDTIFVMELMQMDLGQLTLMRSRPGLRKGKRRFKKPYEPQTSRYIMTRIAAGMEFLHGHGLWHGDLHCSNILVLQKGTCCSLNCSKKQCSPPFKGHSGCLQGMLVKLSDYGSDPVRCAFDYAAPEMLVMRDSGQFAKPDWMSKTDEEKSRLYRQWDVYSFGVLCYQLLSGEFPLDTMRKSCNSSERSREATICKGARPELPTETDEVLKNLIHRCWHSNPECRPGFKEIYGILSGRIQESYGH